MHVAVEEPGRDERAAAVDDLVAVEARADVDDAALLHDHVRLGGSPAGAVDHESAGEDRSSHAGDPNDRGGHHVRRS